MHPVIRIVSFLVFALALSFGTGPQLALGALLLAALLAVMRGRGLRGALAMLSRLRWLLLSILVVYLWFTPGTPLLSWQAAWIPTREGAELGVMRVAMLAIMVVAVNALIAATARERLLGALYWLSMPLRPFGLSRERLVLRMVLALEALAELQRDLATGYAQRRVEGSRLAAAAGTAAQAFANAVERAETAPCGPRRLTIPDPPPRAQWLLPLLLAAAFWAVGRV